MKTDLSEETGHPIDADAEAEQDNNSHDHHKRHHRHHHHHHHRNADDDNGEKTAATGDYDAKNKPQAAESTENVTEFVPDDQYELPTEFGYD